MIQHCFDTELKTLTVIVRGDLLSTNAEGLRSSVLSFLESPQFKQIQCDTLRLDLARARMVDSVGLNLLVTFVRLMKERRGKVQVILANPNIERTFTFTRLNQMLEVMKPDPEAPAKATLAGERLAGQ